MTNIDNIKFFIDNLLNDSESSNSHDYNDRISAFRKSKITKPIVYIGITSSSVVAGAIEALETIKKYKDENDLEFSVIEVGSLGLCSSEPIMDVQIPGKCRVSFQNVTHDLVEQILDGVFNNYLPTENVLAQYRNSLHQSWPNVPFFDELSFFNTQHRVLLSNCGVINSLSIEDAFAFGGYKAFAKILRNSTHGDVCTLVEKSGLRGRGGGGFPTGLKWRTALEAGADQKYFICNADESDPGAFMDRLLMESDPHLIIEGIAISSYAIGASKAFIYTRNRYQL
ncbi:MAG: NADH-quinone oxidoreductase subunit F, partial [Bacteroidetes bacterium HGW-Bacteroidetes-15]